MHLLFPQLGLLEYPKIPIFKVMQYFNINSYLNCSVMSDCLQLHGLEPSRLAWNSPGKNTGVGCHALLQKW